MYGVYVQTQRGTDPVFHLRRLAKANLVYLGLVAVVLLRFWGSLAGLVKGYFLLEAIVLLALVRAEFAAVRRSFKAEA